MTSFKKRKQIIQDLRKRIRMNATEFWFIVIVWFKYSLIQETCGSKLQAENERKKAELDATQKLLDEESKDAITIQKLRH